MSVVYFLLGALVPLPVFYNLLTGEVLVQHTSRDNYLTSFGIPVPIGLVSVLLMGGIAFGSHLLKLRGAESINKNLSGAVLITAGFFSYSLYFLEVPRVISLILPSAALLFVYFYIKSLSLLHYSMRGYVFSMSALIFLHALSIIILEGDGVENNILLFSSFYGYSIYQALVSYSAVLSFLGSTLIIFLFMPASGIKKAMYLLAIVMIFFVLSYGARKAVILDVFILFFAFGLFGFLSLSVRSSIPSGYLKAIAFIALLASYLLFFTEFSARDMSLDGALNQRESDYIRFFGLANDFDFIEFMFGIGGGWGGAHNIFMVMIMRLGFVGLVLFLVPLYLMFRVVSAQPYFHFQVKYGSRYNLRVNRVWVLFLILSLIASNSVNSNFQLPYYVLNVLFISLAYFRENRLQSI